MAEMTLILNFYPDARTTPVRGRGPAEYWSNQRSGAVIPFLAFPRERVSQQGDRVLEYGPLAAVSTGQSVHPVLGPIRVQMVLPVNEPHPDCAVSQDMWDQNQWLAVYPKEPESPPAGPALSQRAIEMSLLGLGLFLLIIWLLERWQ